MKDEDIPTRAEEMFCFAVYTASHAVNRAYTPHLKSLGLTYPQYITLTLLWEKDGQRINDLARLMRMETNTVTPLIKRLEALGHVIRTPSKTDGRAVTIHLTSSGKALRKTAPTITRCMIEGTGLSLDELTGLQALLFKLRDGLQNEG